MWLFRCASLPGPTCVPLSVEVRRNRKVEMSVMPTQQPGPTWDRTPTQNRPPAWGRKKKKKEKKIKVSSLSAARTQSYPTPCPKPTGTGKWNNWCLLLLLLFFFLSEKEKQETTSSDCFCLSVPVFPLCCPQNSSDRPDIGIIFFDSYFSDIWDTFINSSPSGIKYYSGAFKWRRN